MKKSILICLFAGSVVFSLQAAKQEKKSALKTPLDSVSYALGMQVGNDLSKNIATLPGDPLNIGLFIDAMSKALKNDTADFLIKGDNTVEIIQTYMAKAEEDRNKKTEEENRVFLEKNRNNPNVITTASGLQYEVLRQGTGAKPEATDKVKVHYHGTLLDGTVFDSSVERGEPIEFELNRVIAGWTEGLQLMPVGSKYKFYIPSFLGYGARAMGRIKPNSLLIFEVELLDIPQENNTKFQFEPYQRDN